MVACRVVVHTHVQHVVTVHAFSRRRYKPSELLCPRHRRWVPLDGVVDRLTSDKYAALADVSPEEADAAAETEKLLAEEAVPQVAVRIGRRVVQFRDLSPRGVDMLTPPMRDFVMAVGPGLASRCLVDPRLMLVRRCNAHACAVGKGWWRCVAGS